MLSLQSVEGKMLAVCGEKLIFSVPKPQLNPSMYLKALRLSDYGNAEKPVALIHSSLVTNGFGSNLHLNNGLMIVYTGLGDTEYARKVFDRMPKRDVVSWTAMISGYSRCGYYRNALLLFIEMRREGVRANQFTYGSVLKACVGFGCLKPGLQVQGCVEKGRFAGNLFVRSALLGLHARFGKTEDARFLFDSMEERDLVSWNAIIDGSTDRGYAEDAFRLFGSMMREGKKPDCYTFGSVLRASIEVNNRAVITELHGLAIKLGFGPSNALNGSLIDAYVKCGTIADAHKLYQGMERRDIISCTALIMGFARQGNCSEHAFGIFKEIVLMKTGVDEVVLSAMLNVCTNVALVGTGRQLHAFALKCQPKYDVALGNSLIDMYAKCGEINNAVLAFEEMKEKNVISWTSLIAGYGRHGDSKKAIALYDRMEQEGLKPNDVTFLSLLFACSHTGLTEEGWKLFDAMISKYSIEPREEHLSCIVDLFARAGQLEAAYELICKMGVKPSSSIWGAFLGACSRYGNVYLGEVAAVHLLSMEPKKSVNYVMLAGMYADTGAWDNAMNTRKLMKESGSLKDPGYSLVCCTEKKTMLPQHCLERERPDK